MGLWSKIIEESAIGLKIDDGVLVKCYRHEGVVTIPDDVKAVVSNAFEDCEKITINRSPEFILSKLRKALISSMEHLKEENDEDSDSTYYPVCRVFGVNDDEVEALLQGIVAGEKVEGFKEYVAIDAAELGEGRMEEQTDEIREMVSELGYKILFLKNLTAATAETLPRNFLYNLINSHSFNHVDLGLECLIVLGISQGTRLDDDPGDVGINFSLNHYTDLTPHSYLAEIRREGKLIEPDEYHARKEMHANDSKSRKQDAKVIDWEERHFQICLALLSRADITSFHTSTVSTREIAPAKIIKDADRMVEALKCHHAEKEAKPED